MVKEEAEQIDEMTQGKEETISEGAYEKAEENKRSAEAAKSQARPFDYHMHMADHHDNMSQWHASKGRHGEADRHAEKSDEHHEKAMSVKEETLHEAKAGFNGAGGIMNYNDFKQALAMNSGKQVKLKPETKKQADPVMSSLLDKPSEVGGKEAHTQTGSSYTGDESLRRRKAYHKMHEELNDSKMDEIEDDEEGINADIDKISEPEHIMHLYDDSEFMEDDEGETEDEDEKEEVNEALGRAERIKRGIRFKRTEAKRERKKAIALKRMSNSATINKRARRHAIQMMKMRLARKPLDTLSVQEKERLETFVSKRKALIDRMAKRIAPKIRQIEKTRLSRKNSK
jgi:hypothetical protein